MIRALPILLGAALLVAATGGDGERRAQGELRVQSVDDSAYPDVSVVVSAPGEVRPGTAFHVDADGDALPAEATAVAPQNIEVALVVAGTGSDAEVADVRSVVLDIVLRLPPAIRVAVVGTAPHPELLARLGSPLQERVVAASRVEPATRADRQAFALALRQLSDVHGNVRSIVVVGATGDRAAVPQEVTGTLEQRQVSVHAVPAEPGAAEDLVAHFSNLHRVTFEVGEGTREVTIGFGEGSGADRVPVPLRDAAADAAVATVAPQPVLSPGPRRAGEDGGPSRAGASPWAQTLLTLAAAGVMLLSASIVLPGVTTSRPSERAGPWEQAASQPGAGAASEVAGTIVEERRAAASAIWAAGREARLAATVLAAQPLAVGAMMLVAGGDGLARAAGAGSPTVVAAVLLTAAGALWLRRTARPPFSPWPARWRAHARATGDRRAAADTLDRARLGAAEGLPLDESLARAGAEQPDHPARRHLEDTGAAPEGPSADRLAAASRAVRAEEVAAAREQARHGIAATALPFVVCVLPATVLLFVAALSGGG